MAHRINRTMPSMAYAKLSQGMPRRHTSILIQLRTGHAGLNKHLHRIGKVNTPMCAACERAEETMHHFLFRCLAYAEQRRELEHALRRGATSVATLLNRPRAMKHLFKYVSGSS